MSDDVCEPAKLRFYQGKSGRLFVLEMDLPRDYGSSENLDGFVRALKLRVVHGEYDSRPARRIRRLYVEETDGTPLTTARRLEIQTKLLGSFLGTSGRHVEPPLAS